MLTGENIVCFAKDWDETPTSNNHVMTELAKTNRVLWLNSIATRAPTLTSGRDLRKIGRKLASFGRASVEIGVRPKGRASASPCVQKHTVPGSTTCSASASSSALTGVSKYTSSPHV